jgi:GT2 family glycosyltransferase
MTTLHALRSTQPRHVVAIPVKNEARHILPCLEALAAQSTPQAFEVVLLLNDCTDGTADIARHASARLPFRLNLDECNLPPARASAGLARRIAMQRAAERVGPRGVLLTTDADSRVAPDWVANNLTAIAEGADAVAGLAEMDAQDAARLPRELIEAEDRVQLLATMLDEIASRLDPDKADPWPRHVQHSGASIAVTADMFRMAGGIPDVPVGEDRAFFRALERVDARIRHCPQTRVVVSGRLHGRAAGGMADTMRRRMCRPDAWLDDCLEPAADTARRVLLRRTARAHWIKCSDRIEELARSLGLYPAVVAQCLLAPTFGAAWQTLEEHSPVLRRRLIPAADLEAEIRNAADVLHALETRRRTASSATLAARAMADVG